jgi:tRNA-specific 2-thiouridylase
MSSQNYIVAMSGGVDSSVAAALLARQGHRVIGVTLRLLQKETGFGCGGSNRDIDDARAVCAQLGVPHYVLDFSKTFGEKIMDPFVASYAAGETPNPCVGCNRFVKFSALLDKAKALGAHGVATGHYAQVRRVSDGQGERYGLFRAADLTKDQSYVLHNLGQEQLKHLVFPVGHLAKNEVREIAASLNLKTAGKPDSQEICFVPGADTAAFLKSEFNKRADVSTSTPGPIKDTDGKLLGTHKGVAYYTRGQRQGLGLSAGYPLYVVDMDPGTNTLIVGKDEETESASFAVRDVHFTAGIAPAGAFNSHVQIRAHHRAAPAAIRPLTLPSPTEGRGVNIEWQVPQRAVTPGQSAVFYDGEEVLGGGIVHSVNLVSSKSLAASQT